jgi:CheY-like chemotaxis protein/anti-sigma regulatory factor (Ser/Thr protein kinase)
VSQIRLQTDLALDLPMTMLDFHQIQQVLLNLLNNAEQAMVEAGHGGALRVMTRRAGDRIEASISDDGPGVPPEIQSRIFEPFFTTKKEGKGTGLGLSLCHGIIQDHGGTIRVESRPGEGACFIIELPIVQDTAIAGDRESPGLSRPAPSLRILVIDDELALQDFLVDLLRSRGHRVDTASDVPEALKKIAANGHELIISDMKMPHGTGKDIYKAVLDRSPRLARRIVFTTGDGASAETKRFLEETGNEIVLKPFKIEEIERAIAVAARN